MNRTRRLMICLGESGAEGIIFINYSSALAYELISQLRSISSCCGVVHSMGGSLKSGTVVQSKNTMVWWSRLDLNPRSGPMEWTTPQHEEIDLNCEISSYANAEL